MKTMTIGCLLALFTTGVAVARQQALLTASKDNTLYETANGDTSNGAGPHLFVGRVNSTGGGAKRRAVLKFDVAAAIPAGSAITSVSLKMNMSRSNAGAQTVTVSKLTADWGEGTSSASSEGQGTTATTNDATWIYRFYTSSSWTAPGGDFSGSPSASLSINGAGSYTWTSTPQLVADVQGWLNTPASNFGWILIGGEESQGTSKQFDSREATTAANRPTLTVAYTAGTSVGESSQLPTEYGLEPNYPNPFNPSTTISFSLPASEHVTLSIVNVLGTTVATLIDGQRSAGRHRIVWDAAAMASGVYFYDLKAGSFHQTRRMVLMR